MQTDDEESALEVQRALRCALSKREYMSINRSAWRKLVYFTLVLIALDALDGVLSASLIWLPLAVLLFVEIGARWQWRKIGLWREAYDITWNELEITYENSTRATTYKPGAFTKIDEGSHVVSLWMYNARAVLIPNACFSNAAQRQDFLRTARLPPMEPR